MPTYYEPSLCDELVTYCKAHELPFMGPDELHLRDGLTGEQWSWLRAFRERWEAYSETDEAKSKPLKTSMELAGMFTSLVREHLSEEEFGQVMKAGMSPDDFCDSNVVMAAAFMRVHDRNTWLPSDVEDGRCTESAADADLALWNDATELFMAQVSRAR